MRQEKEGDKRRKKLVRKGRNQEKLEDRRTKEIGEDKKDQRRLEKVEKVEKAEKVGSRGYNRKILLAEDDKRRFKANMRK